MPGRAPIPPPSSTLVWSGRIVAQAYRKLAVRFRERVDSLVDQPLEVTRAEMMA